MVINASWVADEITNNTGCDLDWGMFSYPAVTGGVDGTEGMMVGGQGMSINKNSKNAQAAFELIMYLTTGKGDAEVSKASNAIPADPAMVSGQKLSKISNRHSNRLQKAMNGHVEWNAKQK